MKEIGITEIGGFSIGHAQDKEAATGCTVLLFDECAMAGVDIRGGGPASRETPLLTPVMDAKGLHALLLSGGSAFGLDAAGGVMRYLEERGIGFDVGVTKVPLVCQSCVFDLTIGRHDVRPDGDMAYHACEQAVRSEVAEGCVGAGCGCTVGKYRGMDYCMKSGIGTFAVAVGKIKVGAVVAVNAMGDVFDVDSGRQIAGLRREDQKGLRSTESEMFCDMENEAKNGAVLPKTVTNTTIGAVLTNAAFSKAEMNKIASMAQNGLARTIRPVHTSLDGDSVYALSTGTEDADMNTVGTLASYVMGKAINRAVLAAEDMAGYPAAKSFMEQQM